MSEIIKPEVISRRRALSLLGLAAAFGLVVPPTVLTVSDAEAQYTAPAAAPAAAPQTGTQRRHERRAGRHERRHERRAGRHERREERHTTGKSPAEK